MGVICPYCGGSSRNGEICTGCGRNIKWVDVIHEKSEVLYQKGYKLACERQLTQAMIYLRRATQLNKYHMNAHNLLGLICFELGDVGTALKSWILSTSIQKENNLASDYIDQLHKSRQTLENYKQAAKLYNEALEYFKNKNDDMAIIRLKKAIKINSQFAEARNLLALGYMNQQKNSKAMEQVKEVLKLDAYNEKALAYMKAIHYKEIEGKNNQSESTEVVFVPTKMYSKAQKVINRGHVLGTAVIYFIFGLICMFGISVALILPSKTEALETKLQESVRQSEADRTKLRGSLTEASVEIVKLKEENKKLAMQKDELQNMNSRLAQQTRMGEALQMKNEGKWIESAEILYSIARDQLQENEQKQYDSLREEVYPRAADKIYDEGLRQYHNEQYVEALAAFEKVQLYVTKTNTTANSLYYMGMIEEKNNQLEKAMQYYEIICAEYKGNNAYYRAKERLKRIAG